MKEQKDAISVMLIDDNPVFIRAAAQFLEAHDEVQVIGKAGDGEEALGQVMELQPQAVLVDLAMPGLPGLEVIPRLRDKLPEVSIIALTVMDTNSFRQAALDAGADLFIPKSAMRTKLVPALCQVVECGGEGTAESEEVTSSSSTMQRRILVMEDDDHLRRVFARALQAADYEVYQACDVQEASDLLAQSRFDVLICDIHLGKERGTDLLKDHVDMLFTSGAQIVMVSGHPRYRDMCEEMGADFFMEKPVSVSTLVMLMDRLTGRHGYPGGA